MLSDGYTTLTISEKTAEKLTHLLASEDFDSMDEAVSYAVTLARADQNTITDTELSELLYHRLSS